MDSSIDNPDCIFFAEVSDLKAFDGWDVLFPKLRNINAHKLVRTKNPANRSARRVFSLVVFHRARVRADGRFLFAAIVFFNLREMSIVSIYDGFEASFVK